MSKTKSLISLAALLLSACATSNLNADWMDQQQQFIANKHLNQIIIPGTHLSNAYQIDNKSMLCTGESNPQILSANAKLAQLIESTTSVGFINYLNTQNSSISAQLSDGIRYLELQLCLQNTSYYTANYYLTAEMSDVISQIKGFLRYHPQEIIFIDLGDVTTADYGVVNPTDLRQLHQHLVNSFGSYLTPKKNWQKLTFAKLWKTRHRIILFSDNKFLQTYPDIWSKEDTINTLIPQQYTTINKLNNIQQLFSESNTQVQTKFNLLGLYSWFNPDIDSVAQLNAFNSDALLIDYLRALPKDSRLNIILSERKNNHSLVEFAINKNAGK